MKLKTDRLIVLVADSLPAKVPQILINREPLRHLNFDVELLGDCDIIVSELCHRLENGWTSICTTDGPSRQITRDEMSTPPLSSRPSPMSVQPVSEDNSRMSFQQAGDEGSVMSVGGEERTDTSPHNVLPPVSTADASFHTEEKGRSPQTHLSVSPKGGSTGNGIIPSDSSSSLCEMVGHMSTQQEESDDQASNPKSAPKTESEKLNNQIKLKTEDGDSSRGSLSELEELRACWKPRIVNLASRLKGKIIHFTLNP